MPIGRRERAKQEKRKRILAAAQDLFAEHGVGGVTTQQIADRANVAIGTLYLYTSTKAELLITGRNQKFATAIDDGLAAAAAAGTARSRRWRSSTPWWPACASTSRTAPLTYANSSPAIPPNRADAKASPTPPRARIMALLERFGEIRTEAFEKLLKEDAAYRDVLSTVSSLGASAAEATAHRDAGRRGHVGCIAYRTPADLGEQAMAGRSLPRA